MKFGLFYAVELVNALAAAGVMASLFFGGWWLFGVDAYVPPWIIFIAKVYFFYLGLIWLRGTLPRFRIDQLMAFAWKLLIPLALVNLVVVATEVLVWKELELSNWALAAFAVVNLVLAVVLFAAFLRLLTAHLYRLPRRARLVSEVSVPALAAPGTTPS